MKLYKAIKILEKRQKWRLDRDIPPEAILDPPRIVKQAAKVVIRKLKKRFNIS